MDSLTTFLQAARERLANIPPTPFSVSADRMNGFGDGQECENARLAYEITRLIEVVECFHSKLEQIAEAHPSNSWQTVAKYRGEWAREALAKADSLCAGGADG